MRRQTIVLAIFIVGLILVGVIGRQVILDDKLPQQPSSGSPTSENLSESLTDPADTRPAPVEGEDYTLEDERYFDNNNWYVATVTPVDKNAAEPAVVVMKLVDGAYEVAIGPGTSFPALDLRDVPDEVVDYLRSLGRVYGATNGSN